MHPNLVRLRGWTLTKEDEHVYLPGLISTWCDEGDMKAYLERCPGANRCDLVSQDLHARILVSFLYLDKGVRFKGCHFGKSRTQGGSKPIFGGTFRLCYRLYVQHKIDYLEGQECVYI